MAVLRYSCDSPKQRGGLDLLGTVAAIAITFAGGLSPRAVGQEDDAARPSLATSWH